MKIPVKVKIDGVKKLDKYEYNLKLEEIDKLVDQGDYEEAANLADTIEWKRVRNVRTLCLISEIYEAAGRLPDSKRILERAYRKTPVGRNVLYRLVEVTTALQEYDEALEYYTEYVQAAPHDNNRYILKYKLYRGRGSSVEELIAILEEYLGQEYTERWAYELAKLYRQAGQMQKCLAACDDLVLWFHSGKYVQKALELKRKYAALTPKQQQIYEECMQEAAESRLEQEEEHEQPDEPEAAAEPTPEPVVDLGSTDGEVMAEKIIAETEKEIAEEVMAQTQKAEQPDEPETVPAPAPTPKPLNPEELQVNLVRSMREIVSGVGHRPEIPEEDVPASVESRPRMTQKVEVPNTQIPTAGKLSIDDISLSMGEKGKDSAAARAGRLAGQPVVEEKEIPAAVQEPESNETEATATAEEAEEVAQAADEAAVSVAAQQPTEAEVTVDKAAQNLGSKEAAASVAAQQPVEAEVTADKAAQNSGSKEAAASVAAQQPVEVEAEVTADEADDAEDELEAAYEEETVPETPAETGAERPIRRPLPRRSVAEAAVEDLTDAQREALQYTSNPERLLRNKRSLPIYTEDAGFAVRAAEAQGFAAAQNQGDVSPDLGATRKAPSREELLEAARKDLHAGAAMRVRDERTEMADVTQQKAAATGAQPQAEMCHQTPEETDTPMEGKAQELRQDVPVYPEAEYDDYEDAQEDWDESPQESDEDYREPDEPYYDDDYLMIPEHLRGLFSGFTEIPELEDQIANAIIQAQSKGDDRTSKSGNILIFGAHGSGKTTLAMNLAKAIAQDRGSQVVKMAKIFAADLNKKDIAATVAKIAGGTLIIEEAGDLDDETVDQLTTAMELRTDGLILILEDEQKYVHELLMRHPRFTMKFTAQIYIPDYTVEELAMFGQIYANEQDYMIGDEGWDALYEKISALAAVKANDNEPVTIKDVIDMVAKAINHANGFFRKMKMGQKRYDENDYVILFAKDFGK